MPPYGDLLGRESVDSLIDLLFREFIRADRRDKGPVLTVPPKPTAVLAGEKVKKSL